MRGLGALLLAAGSLLVGLCAAARLRARARELEELEQAMELAGYAIERFHRPTPALARELASGASGAGGALFGRLAEMLESGDDSPMEKLWEQALDGVGRAARQCLMPFGQVLGRYGAQEQAQAARQCQSRLHRVARDAARRAEEGGRVYIALAASAGAVLAIIML